jgi:hypothetical protein
MSNEQPVAELPPIVTETQHLLTHRIWDIRQGAYIRGESICILIAPERTEVGSFDVPITVRPLEQGDVSALAGTPLVLHTTHDQNLTWYGRLNQHGQVLFRNLELGVYQVQVVPLARPIRFGQLAIDRWMSPLPQLDLGLAAADKRWQAIYRNKSGSLTAILWEQDTGEIELDFETKEQIQDGNVVAFRWIPQPDGQEQLVLAPLIWSERVQACVAQVHLGRAPQTIEGAALLEEPISPEALAGVPIEVIRTSVARTARAQTRRAWQRLVEEQSLVLPSVSSDAIKQALAELEDSS